MTEQASRVPERAHTSGAQRSRLFAARSPAARSGRVDTGCRCRLVTHTLRLFCGPLQGEQPIAAARLGLAAQVLRHEARQGVHTVGGQQALAVVQLDRGRRSTHHHQAGRRLFFFFRRLNLGSKCELVNPLLKSLLSSIETVHRVHKYDTSNKDSCFKAFVCMALK